MNRRCETLTVNTVNTQRMFKKKKKIYIYIYIYTDVVRIVGSLGKYDRLWK